MQEKRERAAGKPNDHIHGNGMAHDNPPRKALNTNSLKSKELIENESTTAEPTNKIRFLVKSYCL
jgi:hypothetical protein